MDSTPSQLQGSLDTKLVAIQNCLHRYHCRYGSRLLVLVGNIAGHRLVNDALQTRQLIATSTGVDLALYKIGVTRQQTTSNNLKKIYTGGIMPACKAGISCCMEAWWYQAPRTTTPSYISLHHATCSRLYHANCNSLHHATCSRLHHAKCGSLNVPNAAAYTHVLATQYNANRRRLHQCFHRAMARPLPQSASCQYL